MLSQEQFQLLSTYSLPFVAAFVGWGTNTIAVRMLFRPRRPINILGFKLQGLVPQRQKELAEKIADTVEQNLISHRDIQSALQNPETAAQIETLIERQIDIFLTEKLAMLPMLGMFLQGDIGSQIKSLLVSQFKMSIPSLLDSLMEKVEEHVSFREIVRTKVESFDLEQLEGIIYAISARELKTIEVLGGVLGFLVGLCQLGLVFLSQKF
jgi:uncharacterized membrane protein YheB (UPF0754 family)